MARHRKQNSLKPCAGCGKTFCVCETCGGYEYSIGDQDFCASDCLEKFVVGIQNRVRELEDAQRWRELPGEMPPDDTQILIEDINGLIYVISYNQEDGWLEKNAKRWFPINKKATGPTQEMA